METRASAIRHHFLTGARALSEDEARTLPDAVRQLAAFLWAGGAGRAVSPHAVLQECDDPTVLAAGARASCLLFDHEGLVRFADGLRRVAHRSSEAELRWRLASAWSSLFEGEPAGARRAFSEVTGWARAAALADVVVEAHVGQSLAALACGELGSAVEAARRASRMAGAEALPFLELMAHLVLARVRRLSGSPHLAARIATNLADVAPCPYRPWLALELTLAGARGGEIPDAPGAAGPLAKAAVHMLAAARRGDGASLEACLGRLDSVQAPATFLGELRGLGALLQPWSGSDRADSATRAWLEGRTHAVPNGLHGIMADSNSRALAYLVVEPGRPASRILEPGLALCTGATILRPGTPPRYRTAQALADLASRVGEPTDEMSFFESLYGMEFERGIHQNLLDVLVRRVRERIRGVGRLERTTGALVLHVDAPLAVWDPRCDRPLEDRLLALLGTSVASSVEELAGHLDASRRAVQYALRSLLDAGVCVSEKKGRRTVYRVEDTTFSELTRTRFAGLRGS